MSAPEAKKALIEGCTIRAIQLLRGTGNLKRDDLEYVVQHAATLKDERMKECIAELIKWGDDQRAELETLVAIGIEAMKLATPSKMRQAAMLVELRYQMKLPRDQ